MFDELLFSLTLNLLQGHSPIVEGDVCGSEK